jgi:HSP20 family molecular chaperone IbpA
VERKQSKFEQERLDQQQQQQQQQPGQPIGLEGEMSNKAKLLTGLAIVLVSCLAFAGGFGLKAIMDNTTVEAVSVVQNGDTKQEKRFSTNRLTPHEQLSLRNRLATPHLWDAYHDPFAMMNEPFRIDDSRFMPDIAQMPNLSFSSGLRNINVAESEKAVQITAEAPGLTDKDLKVQVDNRALTIKSHKVSNMGQDGQSQTFDESFQQTISLPCDVKGSLANTVVKEGMLTISIPKAVPGAPKSRNKIRQFGQDDDRSQYGDDERSGASGDEHQQVQI